MPLHAILHARSASAATNNACAKPSVVTHFSHVTWSQKASIQSHKGSVPLVT